MASELQRVARGLVECLDQMPQIVAHLQRTAARLRQDANAVAQMGHGDRRGSAIAELLYAAARDCDQAAERCTEAREAGRAWAMDKVSGAPSSDRSVPAADGGTRRHDRHDEDPGKSEPPAGEQLLEERSDNASRVARGREEFHKVADTPLDIGERIADTLQALFGPPPT